MTRDEIYKTLDAIESLTKGEKTFTEHRDDCFTFKYEGKLIKDTEYTYYSRNGRQWKACIEDNICAPCSIEVSEDMMIETIRQAYKSGWCEYLSLPLSLLDPSSSEDAVDYTKQDIDCALKDLTNYDELKALIALADYPSDLAQAMWDSKDKDNWVLDKFKDLPKYNNRVFIKLSETDRRDWKRQSRYGGDVPKYIVISKNPLDYFYCSYGNKFQSCYAMNSNHGYWYGYLPFCSTPQSCIIYTSDGTVRDVSLIAGHKFHCPQMYWRAWGYADVNGDLLVDKFYRSSTETCLIKFVCDFLTEKFGAKCLKYNNIGEQELWNSGTEMFDTWMPSRLKFYSDSLKIKPDYHRIAFEYDRGNHDVGMGRDTRWNGKDLAEYAKRVSKIGDIDFSKPIDVIDGVLCNPIVCPITGMWLPAGVEKSPYAKYFSKPVKALAVVNWCEGHIWSSFVPKTYGGTRGDIILYTDTDSATAGDLIGLHIGKGFNANRNHKMTLKQFKDMIKGNVSKLIGVDAILLRVIEDDKVTCQVFRSK